MKEADIRQMLARKLHLIDADLELTAEEHRIVLPDGRTAVIDILAKDNVGRFYVIELKKSKNSARSAVQQLFKYAAFLKKKYNLRSDQITCVAVSTDWSELIDPFSEFSECSDYQSKGIKILIKGKEISFEEVSTNFSPGGGEVLTEFYFAEFRDEKRFYYILDKFVAFLKKDVPFLNSVIIPCIYLGDDKKIINGYGFSWSVFTPSDEYNGSILRFIEIYEKENPFSDDCVEEFELYDDEHKVLIDKCLILISTIFNSSLRNGEELNVFNVHSLNNILVTWNYEDIISIGPMFSGGIFDNDEITSMCCGYEGLHPYNFVTKISPKNPDHFFYVRNKVLGFLRGNFIWKAGVSKILEDTAQESVIRISIFNPLNLFGLLGDLCRSGETKRIPFLNIEEEFEGNRVCYYGSIVWDGVIRDMSISQAMDRSAGLSGSAGLGGTRLLFQMGNMDFLSRSGDKFFAEFGLAHFILKKSDEGVSFLDTSVEPFAWRPINGEILSVQDFIDAHPSLIDEMEEFEKYSA
ncbi:DUF91 domain-containing protein [Thalassospira sp. HF15]|uniref:endonuclease NucS domain-containing protein n=1 Tax=Thalassospira sp. HF15 TaxID=2722755 RepID=UPI001430AA3E|nr:endonuclease NucS domain-containing protein [Thalassospira sp. HF15]NIY74033.1 DUF91 domain-containing protein [Thalassospira sp. HF15]